MGKPNFDPEFETTNPEWETDFGPQASKRKRILWAALCVVLVLGFFALVLSYGRSGGSPSPALGSSLDLPNWILFVPFVILFAVVALTGERIALWIQRKLNWKSDAD